MIDPLGEDVDVMGRGGGLNFLESPFARALDAGVRDLRSPAGTDIDRDLERRQPPLVKRPSPVSGDLPGGGPQRGVGRAGLARIVDASTACEQADQRRERGEESPIEHARSLISAPMPEESVAGGPRQLAEGVEIRSARTDEIEEMLPLIGAYCEFYETEPNDDGLREMFETLITEPGQGAVFIARDGGKAVGFATLDWKWSSLKAARIGYLEDLFV